MARDLTWLFGLGYTVLGVGYLIKASQQDGSNPTTLGRSPVKGRRVATPSPRAQLGWLSGPDMNLPYARDGKLVPVRSDSNGVRTMTLHAAGSIDNRVSRIVKQIVADSKTPQVVTEARQIVSQKCGSDGDRRWCIPAKAWKQEVAALYGAVTNPNSSSAVRYTRDHTAVDMFASSALMTRLPAEDCFVKGTRVLRDDYKLVPVESVKVGDRIWGKDRWSTVEAVWDKGVLPTWQIRLNNGATMRLTPDHKVYVYECPRHGINGWKSNCPPSRCPLSSRKIIRIHVSDLRPGMVIVAPDRIAYGSETLDADRAWIEGVFIADGFLKRHASTGIPTAFCISGQDGCPKEEQKRRVQAICERLGIPTKWHRKYITVKDKAWAVRMATMGDHAPQKHALSLDLDAAAAIPLLEGIMADSGADSKGGPARTFTTTSYELWLQTRVLEKMRGTTCGQAYIVDHGGLGKNPIWRLRTRPEHSGRKHEQKLLRVKEIIRDDISLPCVDIQTDDHFVWLPEADWTVSNCDGMCVRLGALLRAIGYTVWCRVVAPAGAPGQWSHIYLMVGLPPGENTTRLPLDPTEPQHGPFWEVPARMVSTVKDFQVPDRD